MDGVVHISMRHALFIFSHNASFCKTAGPVMLSPLCTLLLFNMLAWHSRAADLHAYHIDNTLNVTDYNANTIMERPWTWLKSAQDMFDSPAGHVVVQVAKELLHRSAGNSQVLIFSAGLLGAGHWSGYGYGYGRSLERSDNNCCFILESGEDYLITGFLAAQGSGIDDCLYAAACGNPRAAYEYAKAARALLGAIEIFEGTPLDKPRYNDLIVLMESAAYDGYRGISCNTTQKCDGLL